MSGGSGRPLRQSVLAFVAMPGLVAGVVPWLVGRDGGAGRFRPDGLLAILPGAALLLWCVRDFHVRGRGTLAPWAPTSELVVSGPYAHTRNPMYVAVLLVLCGWALGYRSLALVAYALVVAVAFHLRVVHGEEPWLARTHGERWERYRERVPRWLPAWRRRE